MRVICPQIGGGTIVSVSNLSPEFEVFNTSFFLLILQIQNCQYVPFGVIKNQNEKLCIIHRASQNSHLVHFEMTHNRRMHTGDKSACTSATNYEEDENACTRATKKPKLSVPIPGF